MKKLTCSLILLSQKRAYSSLHRRQVIEERRKNRFRRFSEDRANPSKYVFARGEVFKEFKSISSRPLPPRNRKQTKLQVTIKDDFSILKSPEYVLGTIGDLVKWSEQKKVAEIQLLQREMVSHDLSAEVLLAQAVLAIRAHKKNDHKKVYLSGVYPENDDLSKLIKGIGIVEQANLGSTLDNLTGYDVFRASGFGSESLDIRSGDQKLSTIQDFISYMNKSLKRVGKVLTPEADSELTAIIGEIIGNAEDHCQRENKHWQIFAFTDENSKGEIHQQICAFNFGTSISQNLKDNEDYPALSQRISPYVNTHKNVVNEDILYTLQAFQENVSSKLNEAIDHGQGFTDLLQFFESVTQECTNGDSHIEMAVTSGTVHAYFDGKYLPTQDEYSGRHMIYFNEGNKFEKRPDRHYIRNLKGVSFPGTIITLKYRLREQSVESTEDSESE